MKVLIVEDTVAKATEVQTALEVAMGRDSLSIDRARSFIAATRALQKETYDLLILDLVLPIRDDEVPVDYGGRQVLLEMLAGTDCRRASHIICLTAFEGIAGILKNEVEKNLVHVVIYKEGDPQWRDALLAKARYVHQRLTESDNFPAKYDRDVAIVTSSPLVELKEITKLPVPYTGEYHQTDALYYYHTTWKRAGGRSLSVIACAAPTMGMTAACATALKVIQRWRPRFLVMTGIAAGTRKEQNFGDILVAEAAYDYGSGKIGENEDGSRVFIPSPNQLRIDADLHALIQLWEREQIRMDAIKNSWYKDVAAPPRMFSGVLASGAAVVQSQVLVDEILRTSRKVVGLEMEAYAVFHAAHLSSLPRPRVLVAKSISDFANRDKNDDWQQYAAFTSARFVYEFFTNAMEIQFD
jgi:nucleoside phosphorylase/CheY-like chemotaxis protein